ncbi:MAG: DUF6484 domain-containing protein [Pedobacter sp.]
MEKSAVRHLFSAEASASFEGIRVGKIVRINEEGKVLVTFAGSLDSEIEARATRTLMQSLRTSDPVHREVLLVFENNNLGLPIIIDTMHSLLDDVAEATAVALEAEKPEDVLIDGKRITFDAQEEIELRCGKSSITLTKAGKVLIRGAYLLSRSSGTNRIKGGSVQIN